MLKQVLVLVLFVFTEAHLLEVRGVEDNNLNIRCSVNEGIFIEKALWGNRKCIPGTSSSGFSLLEPCESYDKSTFILKQCHGKNECNVPLSRQQLGGRSIYKFTMYVDYQCVPCGQSTNSHLDPHRIELRSTGADVVDYRSMTYALKREHFCIFSNSDLSKTEFEGCPHPAFVAKHIMTRNDPSEDHASLTAFERREVREWMHAVYAPIQTLFYAPTMTYTQRGASCYFDYPAPKFICDHILNNVEDWDCEYMGTAIAEHAVSDGHYQERQLRQRRVRQGPRHG